MWKALKNRQVATYLILLAGATVYSLSLYSLGINITSAQFLKYTLVALVPLQCLLMIVGALCAGKKVRGLASDLFVWGMLLWVPLELIAFAAAAWPLHKTDIFQFNQLPTLFIILIVCAMANSIVAIGGALVFRKMLSVWRCNRNSH